MEQGSDADVIAAIATPPGQGAIGVVRLSGKHLAPYIEKLLGKRLFPRHATFARFLGKEGETLDVGLALFFPGPHSYTGEDVLELHAHGGMAVLNLLLERCLSLGARPAEPGEFTKRAYLNGKLDLAQAEAVADLIAAASGDAARGALRSLQGEFSAECKALRDSLVAIRTRVEAELDFPEESSPFHGIKHELEELNARLDALFQLAREGSVLREGISVALVGKPNVGKSSLLNRLAMAEAAIVADLPGTTRDVIRERIVVNGVPINVVDTAGLREVREEVERAGVERAWNEAGKADVIVLVIDVWDLDPNEQEKIETRLPRDAKLLRVFNKIDLIGAPPRLSDGGGAVWVSAKTGAGIELLKTAVLEAAGYHAREPVFVARERHLRAMKRVRESVVRATALASPELVAEELRIAQEAMGSITGEFVADDLLGEIFSKFCIGK